MGKKEQNIDAPHVLITRRSWMHSLEEYIVDTLSPPAQEGKPYTVYALIDPRDYCVRYIGITNNVYQRFMDHLRCDGSNPDKDAWVIELKQADVMLIMKTLETVDIVERARERETYWIHYHLFLKVPLFNQAIPTIRIESKSRPGRTVVPKVRDSRPVGRKYTYEKVREIILYRYQHKAWPDYVSREMQLGYEFNYFVKPRLAEKDNAKKYAKHKRS